MQFLWHQNDAINDEEHTTSLYRVSRNIKFRPLYTLSTDQTAFEKMSVVDYNVNIDSDKNRKNR